MTANSSTVSIGSVVDQLQTTETTLKDEIEKGKTSLADDQKQQAQIKSDITALKEAPTKLANARNDASTASAEAGNALSQIQPLLDELGDAVKDEIDAQIVAIDKRITDQESVVTSAKATLVTLETEWTKTQQEYDLKKAERDQAVRALRELPATIAELRTRLQRVQKDMTDAAKAGQSRKAYVLSKSLQEIRAKLNDLRADGFEQKLASDYARVNGEFEQKRTDLVDKRDKVDEQRATLQAAEAKRKRLDDNRENDLKKLYDPSEQPATGTRVQNI